MERRGIMKGIYILGIILIILIGTDCVTVTLYAA